jgi:hypothetical protein
VRLTGKPSAASWARGAARGESFFTTGPLLFLEVDGCRPGEELRCKGPGPHVVKARVRARSEVAPVTHLEILQNGKTVGRLTVPREAGTGQWLELEESLKLTESAWIAARAYSLSRESKPDSEAHTNPVYVYLNGKAPYAQEDLDWLLDRLEGQIETVEKRTFPEKAKVLDYYQRSREELKKVRQAGGQAPPQSP